MTPAPESLVLELREHLIEKHGFTDDYFEEDYKIGGPIRDIQTLRWLHAPWVYAKGCARI